ncbi:MAG: hypothetical protein EOO89_08600 [Pedobacter sp.]|nr:MAG: hypothetical protein EOO89_08600 [Pedobacter sp.]
MCSEFPREKFTTNLPFASDTNIDESIRHLQTEKLNALKSERNNAEVENALRRLRVAAEGSDNLMPFILTAVEAYATLGEICDTMREVFGEY